MSRNALIDKFGGACQQCGYTRCRRALHFHHVVARQGKSGKVDLQEVASHPERFALLCANCHIEEHDRADKSRRVFRTCAQCGVEFFRRPNAGNGSGLFCSKPCADASKVKRPHETDETRLLQHTERVGACLIFTGHMTKGVIPVLMVKNLNTGKHAPHSARRIAYRLRHGHEPAEKRIYVSCGNARCVEPDHFCTRSGQPLSQPTASL